MSKSVIAGRFAPSVLDPKAVALVEVFDSKEHEGPNLWAVYKNLLAPEAKQRGWGMCTMCGQALRYVALVEFLPTSEIFIVGQDCAESLEIAAMLNVKVSALAAKAKIKAENLKIETKRAEILASDVEFAAAVESVNHLSFVQDIVFKMGKYGLSDNQRNAVIQAAAKEVEIAAKKAAEALLPVSPVLVGKGVVILGEVISTKWAAGYAYHSPDVQKMLVRDDRGFKVFGTVPSGLNVERGDRVKFMANTEASKDDENFGFFSRPRKAVIVDELVAA